MVVVVVDVLVVAIGTVVVVVASVVVEAIVVVVGTAEVVVESPVVEGAQAAINTARAPNRRVMVVKLTATHSIILKEPKPWPVRSNRRESR